MHVKLNPTTMDRSLYKMGSWNNKIKGNLIYHFACLLKAKLNYCNLKTIPKIAQLSIIYTFSFIQSN